MKRSLLRPSVAQIGRWQPLLVLFTTSRSETSLAEDTSTGKSLLITYLKPNARRANRLFRRNIENVKNHEKRTRVDEIDGAPVLIQPFRDEKNLSKLLQDCRSSGKKIPGPVVSRMMYSIGSKAIQLLRKKIRFEFHLEAITINRHGKAGFLFALPDRNYKLFHYQVPNLLIAYFSPFNDLMENKGNLLQTFLSYPTLENLRKMRSEAATKTDLQRWLRRSRTGHQELEDDSELEMKRLQSMTGAPHEATTVREESEFRRPDIVPLGPVPVDARKKTGNWFYFFAAAVILMLLVAAWNFQTPSENDSRAQPINSPPVLVHAPDLLYRRSGSTVATVLLHVDENGTVVSHQFQRATPNQIALYNGYVRKVKFQASYKNRKATSAWLILKLPLQKRKSS